MRRGLALAATIGLAAASAADAQAGSVSRPAPTADAASAARVAPSASHDGPPRPGPPTAASLRLATQRFLAQHRAPAPLPRPGRRGAAVGALLPAERVVALYGAPQRGSTIRGLRSPRGAARQLAAQSEPYAIVGERPVAGAFDLVSVFATAGAGADGLYRSRQSDEVIEIYLERARAVGARLMLDIQPGRSQFLTELRELREWVAQPDVDIALDPEWNVGRRGIPGRTAGSVGARQVNRVARSLARTVTRNGLPPKLLVVHQFRRGSVRHRRRISQRPGVQVVLNFDGIGAPGPKAAGFEALAVPRLFNGFSLFYRRDTPLMRPASVLALDPEPDFLLYQ